MTSSRFERFRVDELPPEQRRQEVAAILVRGILRLRSVPEESAQHDLDVSPDSRLNVTEGLTT